MTQILDGGKVWDTDRMEKLTDFGHFNTHLWQRLYRMPDGSFVEACLDYKGFKGFWGYELHIGATPYQFRPMKVEDAKLLVKQRCTRETYERLFGTPDSTSISTDEVTRTADDGCLSAEEERAFQALARRRNRKLAPPAPMLALTEDRVKRLTHD